jgi:hypothetical protein
VEDNKTGSFVDYPVLAEKDLDLKPKPKVFVGGFAHTELSVGLGIEAKRLPARENVTAVANPVFLSGSKMREHCVLSLRESTPPLPTF